MVVSNISQRINYLTNSIFPQIERYTNDENILVNPTIKMDLAELYYLRDMDMRLDPKTQILWAMNKLRQNDSFRELAIELTKFEGTSDNSAFYKFCTLDALLYLGY